jgi:hypothetical protein
MIRWDSIETRRDNRPKHAGLDPKRCAEFWTGVKRRLGNVVFFEVRSVIVNTCFSMSMAHQAPNQPAVLVRSFFSIIIVHQCWDKTSTYPKQNKQGRVV